MFSKLIGIHLCINLIALVSFFTVILGLSKLFQECNASQENAFLMHFFLFNVDSSLQM